MFSPASFIASTPPLTALLACSTMLAPTRVTRSSTPGDFAAVRLREADLRPALAGREAFLAELRVAEAFRAGPRRADFFAPPCRAPAFFAADFRAPPFFAALRRAVDFFAPPFLAVRLRALAFFAPPRFAAPLRALDFFADAFFADFLRPDFARDFFIAAMTGAPVNG